MVAHRRAGAALLNAGRYADARAVWREGHRAHDDELCSGLAHMAAVFAEAATSDGDPVPPTITDGGDPIDVAHLDPAALAAAGETLAGRAGQDPSILTAAGEAAAEESGDRYRALLVAYVEGGEDGAIAYQRLSSLIDRRRARSRDVAGLFDPAESE
jgi:hypothetical protein